jgi:hypothetical protein
MLARAGTGSVAWAAAVSGGPMDAVARYRLDPCRSSCEQRPSFPVPFIVFHGRPKLLLFTKKTKREDHEARGH